jgi:hypothetical protein
MPSRAVCALALALGLTAAGPAATATFEDPEWPCVQRKVPELTIGQMWTGPVPPEDWQPDEATEALARRLTPRVVPVEQVAEEAGTWAASLGEEEREARLGELFATILQQVNRERGEVIAGIGRYAGRQESYSQEIDALQQELADLEAVPEADRNWDRVEELQDRLVWETRIYRDRAQSLTYVCETPVLLEQRAFAIARALAGLI